MPLMISQYEMGFQTTDKVILGVGAWAVKKRMRSVNGAIACGERAPAAHREMCWDPTGRSGLLPETGVLDPPRELVDQHDQDERDHRLEEPDRRGVRELW